MLQLAGATGCPFIINKIIARGGAASRPKVYHQLMLLLLLTSFLREGRELGILMRGAGKHSFYYSTPSASLDVLLLILIHKGRGQAGKQRTH